MNALATIARWITAPVRYWGEVLGEKDYEKYVAHLKRHHPSCPIPTEREYGTNGGRIRKPILDRAAAKKNDPR